MRGIHQQFSVLAAIMIAAMPGAFAATVSVQPREEYTRLLFNFDKAAKMDVAEGGKQITLTFNQPLDYDVRQLEPRLDALAKRVELSPDGTRVVLHLKAVHRTRQFVSGSGVGIDIMRETPAAEKPKAPAETTAIRTEPAPILTTKPALEAPSKPLLTTKQEAPPAPAKEPAAEKPPAPEKPAQATAPPPPGNSETNTETKAETKPSPAEKKPAGAFVVGAQPSKEGVTLNFPFTSRVAAAIYERDDAIWLVFSQPQNANLALLRTVLPRGVTAADQFRDANNTVIRLRTDGKLHATASQPADSYQWQVMLSGQSATATLDVPVSGERDNRGQPYLLLSAFDIAPPLRFTDPDQGDTMIVVPAFELGRGVTSAKSTPELEILPTQQGIAVASLRDGVTTTRDRTGVKIMAPGGMAVSQNLPTVAPDAAPVPGVSATSNVMIPYDQWYVAPADFEATRQQRELTLAQATQATRADALLELMKLYLGQGFGAEAQGYLTLLEQSYPSYYKDHKLALPHAAANFLTNNLNEAMRHVDAPELNDSNEAQLWRDVIGLFRPAATPPQAPVVTSAATAANAPAASPQEALAATSPPAAAPPPAGAPPPPRNFDFLAYNKPYIRFYPPRIRQRLAVLAADRFVQNNHHDKALAVYETLSRDNILGPVQPYAELSLAHIAIEKGKLDKGMELLTRLSTQQDDRYIQARARYDLLMLQHSSNEITTAQWIERLEQLRLAWHGDGLEREILVKLASLYKDQHQYDQALRSWKTLLQTFPGDPDTLTIAGDMTELFERLFLEGLADQMPPLKSLGLFYEFRELTPLGPRGDHMIQKLADRLAAVDLLSRATQLLEHQVRFRVGGEERARVGARLALLYLLDQQPQRALEVLEITSFGGMEPNLVRERLHLNAKALAQLNRGEEALSLLAGDASSAGAALRLDLLWDMQDWPNIINSAEDMLSARPNLTEPLDAHETPVLLKLALAYSFENDPTQLRYLRDYYMELVPDGPYKEIFDYITNDTSRLDPDDFNLVAQQISNTENFLDTFKKKIADGRLSDVASDKTPSSNNALAAGDAGSADGAEDAAMESAPDAAAASTTEPGTTTPDTAAAESPATSPQDSTEKATATPPNAGEGAAEGANSEGQEKAQPAGDQPEATDAAAPPNE